MKILQVITSLRVGGAEKLIVDMIPRLQERGHEVDLLLFNGADTPLKEKLQKEQVRILEFGKGGSVYNPMFILKLVPLVRTYDLIHTHNTACQYFAAIAKIISFSKIRLITTEHSTSNRRRNKILFKILDRFIYKRYTRIVCISTKTTEHLSRYLNRKENIHTIFNGIPLSDFQHADGKGKVGIRKKEQAVIVTMVGGFRIEKDQDTLIRALSVLPERYCLWLVGDGARKQQCMELSEKYAVDDRVVFTGIRSDIPQILKASDVVVMSSHWEGFGLAAVEGMAAGKPVIASDVPGLSEVVGNAGILFEKGDSEDLARKIRELCEDEKYYRSIATRCMERASRYDISEMVDGYDTLYKRVKS